MPKMLMLTVDGLAIHRSPHAYVVEAQTTERTYGDWCYLCGMPANTGGGTVVPVKQVAGSTDESICGYCLPRLSTVQLVNFS